MELTTKKAHIQEAEGLNEELKKKSLLELSEIKVGQVFEQALVLGPSTEQALNLRHSKPLQVQVSARAKGSIPFNQIVTTKELAKFGSDILLAKTLKGGSTVKVTYQGNGNFTLLKDVKKVSK